MSGIAQKPTRVTLRNPAGPPVPDAKSGYVVPYLDVTDLQAGITPATPETLERIGAGTVVATATHLVTIWYRPDVTTKSQFVRLSAPTRVLNVLFVGDPNEKHVELELLCAEVVS